MRARVLTSLTLSAVLFAGSVAFAQGPDEEQFKTLYRDGLDLYLRGQKKEAYEKLEQALRIKVDDKLVLYMRDEMSWKTLEMMLMDGGETRQTALRIMELAKSKAQNLKKNTAEIEAYVLQLDSPKFIPVTDAEMFLRAIGTYSLGPLIDHLGDAKSETLRTNVIVVLSHMQDEATLAVADALNSTDKLTQQNACVVLGNIGDIRGLAELRRVVESGGADAEVKSFAQRAIDRIVANHPEETSLSGKSAKETYVILAERWYRSHPSVMHYMFGDYVIWRWSASQNKIVGRDVPPYAMNEELAEEACHDAIQIDNAYADAWSLIACVSFQQYEEAQIALEAGEKHLALGEIKPEDLDKLKIETASIEQANFLGVMAGRDALYRALSKSLADDTAQVSVAICWALGLTALGADLTAAGDVVGPPLCEALKNADKRVQYASAEAIIKLNPTQNFANMELVAGNLGKAIREQAVRVALLVEPDDTIRAQMADQLNTAGIYVVQASSAKHALLKIKEFPIEDVIICDGQTLNTVVFSVEIRGKNQAETSVLDSLQQDLRTKQVPVVVTGADGTEVTKWQGIFKTEVKDYAEKNINGAAWQAKLDPLIAPTMDRSKARAEKAAISAAEALARVRIQNTIFTNFQEAVDGGIAALDGRTDTIRRPVCWALGALGNPSALDALSKVLADASNDKTVRVAAAEGGLAHIYQQSAAAPSEDQVKALIAGITDADVDVQRATSKAIGAARMTNEQRAAIFAAKRLHQLK
ncbi:MAG: hypothetical protein FD180_2749 [Planctomycetota bacterium]|nr:MAG: hypothetical protein FD180_2749 [Planctomycetota bacterium]